MREPNLLLPWRMRRPRKLTTVFVFAIILAPKSVKLRLFLLLLYITSIRTTCSKAEVFCICKIRSKKSFSSTSFYIRLNEDDQVSGGFRAHSGKAVSHLCKRPKLMLHSCPTCCFKQLHHKVNPFCIL